MSMITKPPLLDETGHLIVEGIARQNLLLTQLLSAAGEATPIVTLNEIHEIVRSGEAARVFTYGDQIFVNYNDGSQNYVLPFDIVHFADVTLQDGETVPGMFIQSHYAMEACQFDAAEAFYVVTGSALAAGTYNITMGNAWGQIVANKTYQFTLSQDVPVGGQLLLGLESTTTGFSDKAPNLWRVWVFASATATTPTEKLTLTEGATGTSLGTLASATKYGTSGMNNMQRCSYGYNRWAQSGLRQRLNSAAAAGAWWAAQNPYDRAPEQLSTLRGFMAGFDDAFLNIIKPVKVRTALNTLSDSEIGAYEDTFDTFFPASLEQEYIVPQASGVEGEYWEYWKRRLGLSSPQAQGNGGTNAYHIRYAYNARTSARNCRLRSAGRADAYYAWSVGTSGTASYYYASYAGRCAPACVIC
jgi:hypothetical protein